MENKIMNEKELGNDMEIVLSGNRYEKLDEEKLPVLLNLKCQAIADAVRILWGVDRIRNTFLRFQRVLYSV